MKRFASERLERKIVLGWLRSQNVVYERKRYDKVNKDTPRRLIYSFFIRDNLEELDGNFSERFGPSQELRLIGQTYGKGCLYEGRNIEVEITQKSRALPNNPNILWGWFVYKNRLKAKPLSFERLQQEFPKYQNEFEALGKKVLEANSLAILRQRDSWE